jgi:hypothetical protein
VQTLGSSALKTKGFHDYNPSNCESWAHILVAFLAYCLSVTLKHRLQAHAPGLTPRAVLEKLASIQMLDVSFPTADGRCLTMPRYTEPAGDIALLLHHLQLTLPNQPPPRIAALSGEPLPSLKM